MAAKRRAAIIALAAAAGGLRRGLRIGQKTMTIKDIIFWIINQILLSDVWIALVFFMIGCVVAWFVMRKAEDVEETEHEQ